MGKFKRQYPDSLNGGIKGPDVEGVVATAAEDEVVATTVTGARSVNPFEIQ